MAGEPTKTAYEEILARLRELREIKDNNKAPVIPLIDPTANVLSLVKAAMERQDDLRAAEKQRTDDLRAMEIRAKQEEATLREKLSLAESTRIDALNLAEARRLDAVLAEQKAAVALASEKSSAGAAQLAQSVVAAAATTAASLESMRAGFDARVTRLEQQQYQTGGRDVERVSRQGQSNVDRGLLVGIVVVVIGWAITIATFLLKR